MSILSNLDALVSAIATVSNVLKMDLVVALLHASLIQIKKSYNTIIKRSFYILEIPMKPAYKTVRSDILLCSLLIIVFLFKSLTVYALVFFYKQISTND